MYTNNCDVVETAIEIGGEVVYFTISNDLYELMWIPIKCLKFMAVTIAKNIFLFICVVQPDK